ncbi:hypothetical protein [Gloeothece verrucosa]|uniref:Uncharacterized protein n=1 Tax=Gloeothece verrucosa (strain PCC 7822) TaxID=497965 RepID=E0UF62_GLOV7|nr:hypothetical protein [Gloeothece verrucosa]ADN14314.1 conserved hypothetical protein [Gloeothece verrucosa PCC 7822]
MNLSVVLDVIISFSFIYLLLSLVASEIQELIATLWQWRSRHLKYSIAKLFGLENKEKTDKVEDNKALKLTEKIWENSLIRGLYQTGKYRMVKFDGPSYIKAKTFSEAFLSTLSETEENFPKDIKTLKNNIEQSPLINKSLKESLLSLVKIAEFKVKEGQNAVLQFQKELEIWFDDSMARAAGAYKRNAKGVALIIALALAVAVNADTVYIFNSLSKNSTLRMTINQLADEVIQSNYPKVSDCLDNAQETSDTNNCFNPVKEQINTTFNDLSTLPIGWDLSHPWDKQFLPLTQKNVFKAIIGWVVSAIAISMGAPFWFEFLNKFINIRNTGKKPS